MKEKHLLDELQNLGVEFYVIDGGKLKIKYDDTLVSDGVIEHIRQKKAEIIKLLSEGTNKRAKGYGCGACGCKTYQAVKNLHISNLPESSSCQFEREQVTSWICEGCGSVYEIIGGSKGPVFIN